MKSLNIKQPFNVSGFPFLPAPSFRISFPMIWREVEESNKNIHTFLQYACLWEEKNENNQLLLPRKMWTNGPGNPRVQEGEMIEYTYDLEAAWNLNNISYLNK